MPTPRLHGHFDDCEEHTDRGQKSLGALSVLLMLLHTPFKIGDAPTIAIAHEPGHLLLKHAEVAEYLGFEFIHHPHSLDSIGHTLFLVIANRSRIELQVDEQCR
jgi:hypothetical protein